MFQNQRILSAFAWQLENPDFVQEIYYDISLSAFFIKSAFQFCFLDFFFHSRTFSNSSGEYRKFPHRCPYLYPKCGDWQGTSSWLPTNANVVNIVAIPGFDPRIKKLHSYTKYNTTIQKSLQKFILCKFSVNIFVPHKNIFL